MAPVARLRHLVVVIPGIGGSVLETLDGTPAWGQGRRALVGAALNPTRLSLAEHPTLRPVGLVASTRVLPWQVVPGYDGLVRQIVNAFRLHDTDVDVARDDTEPNSGASVLLFGYDFRAGVPAAAERLHAAIERRLAGLTGDARRKKVIIVAHSMGGLVARYWLGPLHGAASCRALVTLGTPHRGAPRALDWLVNGVRLGPGPVGALSGRLLGPATEVLREWPSTYHLLPRYRAVRDEATGEELYPHELGTASWQPFTTRAAEAFGMHRDIEDSWAELDEPARPEVLAMFARGHGTAGRAVLAGGRVRVTKDDAEWLPNVGWRGDGTVPALSAFPIEVADDVRARRAVPDRHGPMAASTVAVDVLREYEGEPTGSVRGDTPERPWLGLDFDDVLAAGEPFPVAAQLLGADDVEGAVAWLRITPDDGDTPAPRAPLRMSGSDGRWEATVPALAPGRYRLAVEAVDVPRVDQVDGTDVIGVIEG